MKVAVVGAGYVGLSNAVMLARHHEVVVLDTDAARVTAVNERVSPFADAHLQACLDTEPLNLRASGDAEWVLQGAAYVFVAVPTNLNSGTGQLDTSGLDDVLARIRVVNADAIVAIRSTVPMGFTASAAVRHGIARLYFVPEFLREGQALHDSLHPSRVVVGGAAGAGAQALAQLLLQAAQARDVPVLLMGAQEAEAVKLLSNTYLAMRVAFFNEVDNLAWSRHLDARMLIEGLGLDPRIGSHYNNPSFGFGGYCLPKDVQQIQSEWPTSAPHALVDAIARSNDERVQYMAQAIAAQSPHCVGVYRLVMKAGSDNWRGSSSLVLVRRLQNLGVRVIIHEPLMAQGDLEGCTLVSSLHRFKAECDLIVANRRDAGLLDVASKVFSRDLFGGD